MTDDEDRWAYLAEGNATQARKRVAVDVLIRDEVGRILLVDPNYKEFWDLPGGMAESNEPPRSAAERELREELALSVTAGKLLTVDWVAAHGPWDDQIVFVFDGGTLSADQAAYLRVADSELDGFAFLSNSDCVRRLRPDVAQRLDRALAALQSGEIAYTETE